MYTWWRFLHVLGALGFLAAHGATAAVAMRLRKERDPAKIRALLGLSRSTRPWMYVSLLLLIAAGVIAGFQGHWWDEGWIWTALILLVVLLVAAFPLAVPYYVRVRRAVAGGCRHALGGVRGAPPVAAADRDRGGRDGGPRRDRLAHGAQALLAEVAPG